MIDMAGWHADLHELRFDENTLFIPSDGGIVRIANKLDLIRQYQGEGSYPSDTRRNKTLPVLMFFDPGSNPRQFSGSMESPTELSVPGPWTTGISGWILPPRSGTSTEVEMVATLPFTNSPAVLT